MRKVKQFHVLQLYSSWKWTGPAEWIALITRELRARGHCARLWVPPPPQPDFVSFHGELSQRRVEHCIHRALDRKRLIGIPTAARQIARTLDSSRPDVIHVNASHDHLLAGAVRRWRGLSIPIIRSDHYRDGLPLKAVRRPLLFALTDAVLAFSEKSRKPWIEGVGLPAERVFRIDPAIDVDRFNPENVAACRPRFQLSRDDCVVGVVSRLQQGRHLEAFLSAFASARRRVPRLKALILGRSSQMERTVREPVRDLGIEPFVRLPGYQTDRYTSSLVSMDLFVFLRAGSDGYGRALLEAMAMGLPVIVNRTGMLMEFVDDGRSGLLFDGSVDDLARKIVHLATSAERRRELGATARKNALRRFDIQRQAGCIEKIWHQMGGDIHSDA